MCHGGAQAGFDGGFSAGRLSNFNNELALRAHSNTLEPSKKLQSADRRAQNAAAALCGITFDLCSAILIAARVCTRLQRVITGTRLQVVFRTGAKEP